MSLLYKYVKPDKAEDGTPAPILLLQTMQLTASNPLSFNDPFEVRPWFDQERHNHFANSHESFHRQVAGVKHSLAGSCTMVDFPTERAADFGEHLNKRFRDEVERQFRVLCLSRNPKSVLMWAHYACSHAGVVLGFDTSMPGFPRGIKLEGLDIDYTQDRSKTKLPLAFYRNPCVEEYDLFTRQIVNSPEDLVESEGGTVITFREYRRQVEAACITALTTKAADWRYEQEVRFIYDLSAEDGKPICADGRHFLPIPSAALREIIVGFRADCSLVGGIVDLFQAGRIGTPKLFFAGCHPNLYEVQAHQADAKYLLDYFQAVRPSLD